MKKLIFPLFKQINELMNPFAVTTIQTNSQGFSLPKIGTLIPNRIFVGGISSNVSYL